MAGKNKNKNKINKKRTLHPKNQARAAAAAAAKRTEEPPPSEETAAEPVSGVTESSEEDGIGSGEEQESYRLLEVGLHGQISLHEYAWHLVSKGEGYRRLTDEEVSEVVSDERRWRWEAYESKDDWHVNNPYLVRFVSTYGMIMGRMLMFNDRETALACRDMLNTLEVMPESSAYTPEAKQEKLLRLIEAPERYLSPCAATDV